MYQVMGRRQVVRHLVLVQTSRRFESFRPRIYKKLFSQAVREFFIAENIFL